MTDQKPYFIRALYEWIADNGARPHVRVDTTYPGVCIPPHLYEAVTGKPYEIFNIAVAATLGLAMDNNGISCSARFGTTQFNLYFPIESIEAIFSPDNPIAGQGMQFNHVLYRTRPPQEAPVEAPPTKPAVKEKPSFLKVVK